MTSPSKSKEIRNTFGIFGYADILSAHLERRILTTEELQSSTILEERDRKKSYLLVLDNYTNQFLQQFPHTKLIISFQRRVNGNFAIARLTKD